MKFIFVDVWGTLENLLYDVNRKHWHFVFGTEVMQTDYSFQLYKYFPKTSYILRGRIDNASVAFLKSVSI